MTCWNICSETDNSGEMSIQNLKTRSRHWKFSTPNKHAMFEAVCYEVNQLLFKGKLQ